MTLCEYRGANVVLVQEVLRESVRGEVAPYEVGYVLDRGVLRRLSISVICVRWSANGLSHNTWHPASSVI